MVDPNASEWLKAQQKSSRRHRIIIVILAFLILAGIAGGVAYAFIKKPSGGGSSPSSGSNGGADSNGGGGGVNSKKYFTWDNKPVDLNISPDPKLKKIFYGVNYGPVNASFPWCTNTLGDVIEDIKIISQITNRIRLYGMDCNAADYTLEAIKLLKLSMTIVPTIWVDNNDTTYKRQYDDFFNLIDKYGVDNIDGVSVGNEVIFRKDLDVEKLYSRIGDVREKLNSLDLKKKLPVFTSDIGSNVDEEFAEKVDEIWANVHPYFAGVNAKDASNWTITFFNGNDVYYGDKVNKPTIMSEIGWPTAGDSHQAAEATVPNLQIFLDTFVCEANKQNIKYYYFETLDAPWKVARWTLLEGSWGLFSPERVLKAVTFPDCLSE